GLLVVDGQRQHHWGQLPGHNQALEIRVNNARALRVVPGSTPNLIGGITWPNRVTDAYGAIGGGANNQAGNADTDPSNALFATVGGGGSNTASGGGPPSQGALATRQRGTIPSPQGGAPTPTTTAPSL
ncbi:MAG: hypothetical protein ACK4K2_07020, partial [Dehalococcoidia bacterium]